MDSRCEICQNNVQVLRLSPPAVLEFAIPNHDLVLVVQNV